MKKYLIINLVILGGILVVSLFVGLFFVGNLEVENVEAATIDKTPPKIFNSKVDNITATSAVISWQTDEESDSLVNFGLNSRYGMVRDPFFDKTDHQILLDDLLPGTSYYFRIISSDDSGNQIISNDFTFNTEATEEKKQESKEEGTSSGDSDEDKEFPNKYDKEGKFKFPLEEEIDSDEFTDILEKIQKITSEKVLEVIEKQIQQQVGDVQEALIVILDKADVETDTNSAIISWKTNKPANSIVSLVKEDEFNVQLDDPYTWQEGQYDESVMEHRIEINGLDSAVTYHFQISSESSLGRKVVSKDDAFMTKSILPEIHNISITKVEEDSATITFTTNVPCSSLLEYTNMSTAKRKLEGSSNYTTIHTIRLSDLDFDTYYSVVITAENPAGDKTKSSPLIFLTIKDMAPPVISKINTESTLYSGGENKVQTIVGWETDEPAICQIFYHQGLTPTDDAEKLEMEGDYTQKHIQVTTNLLPATVYKFWMECFDDVHNKTVANDFIMLTPSREESIIDIILKNFESTFGWVKGS